jgi:hypothetical protein
VRMTSVQSLPGFITPFVTGCEWLEKNRYCGCGACDGLSAKCY